MKKIPKVFISYSHDTMDHKKWVMELATRMRNNGIDSIIDQWELKPGDDLPHFMETNLESSDKVIMICTEKYVDKANSGTGGVGYEKMIVTSSLLRNIDENKIIPIIKQVSTKKLPTFLKTKLYIDFSKTEDLEFSFDELIRTIHNSPVYKKPEIGDNPFKEVTNESIKKVHDGILEIIEAIVYEFDKTTTPFVYYQNVKNTFSGSRIMLDVLLNQAQEKGYISRDKDGDIVLTEEGKLYAINNDLA